MGSRSLFAVNNLAALEIPQNLKVYKVSMANGEQESIYVPIKLEFPKKFFFINYVFSIPKTKLKNKIFFTKM